MHSVNIGCGQTPTEGWKNFDNSLSLKLAGSTVRFAVAKALGFLSADQLNYIDWLRDNRIEFADAVRRIPLPDASSKVVYTSHMLEHISRDGARAFLLEAKRVLAPGGVLRIVVPDLGKAIERYNDDGDAEAFMEHMLVAAPPLTSVRDKVHLLFTGYRHHQWMYDGRSLSALLEELGFRDVVVQPAGETMIEDPGTLDLFERSEESVYVEARR